MKTTPKEKPKWIARTIAEAAGVIGVSPRQFSEYLARGMPGRPKCYDLKEIIRWCKSEIWKARVVATPDADPLMTGSDSPALEKYREQKARQEAIKTWRMEGEYMPTSKARDFVTAVATALKDVATEFEKRFGNEAVGLFERGLKSVFIAEDRYLNGGDDVG